MRKKCEARIPNTCFDCESSKHGAGKSLCRVEKRKSYLEEVRSTYSEYLFWLRECESTKQAKAYAEYNFINNFERNSFCYKTL